METFSEEDLQEDREMDQLAKILVEIYLGQEEKPEEDPLEQDISLFSELP